MQRAFSWINKRRDNFTVFFNDSVEFLNSYAVQSHKMWRTASNGSYPRFYFVTLTSVSRTETAETNKRLSMKKEQLRQPKMMV